MNQRSDTPPDQWEQFLSWWTGQNIEAPGDETSAPLVGYKMVAWSAWNARAKTQRSERFAPEPWWPCSQHLPVPNDTVLLTNEEWLSTGYWTGHEWQIDVQGPSDPGLIPTHWMLAPSKNTKAHGMGGVGAQAAPGNSAAKDRTPADPAQRCVGRLKDGQ